MINISALLDEIKASPYREIVIRTPHTGVVTFADPGLYLTGGTVVLDHGHGVSSNFLHLSRIDVRVGDVIEMPAGIVEKTRFLLNNTPKYQGTVGIEGDHVAVNLTKKITETEIAPPKPYGR